MNKKRVFILSGILIISFVLSYFLIPYIKQSKPKEYEQLIEEKDESEKIKLILSSQEFKNYDERVQREKELKRKKEEEARLKRLEEERKRRTISLGDSKQIGDMNIVFKKSEFSNRILPDNTNGGYAYQSANPGKIYLQIDTDIKNNGKYLLPCSGLISSKLNYNNGYNYTGRLVPEGDEDWSLGYENSTVIDPLETRGVRIVFEIPKEIEDNQNSIEIELIINGETFNYKFR
ncbi:DUF4352 domain-containing protein [Clostridium cadaveris]|uniref:DUF4352 domain-containing protein n=1 Tax=Clostridium cadaveris TaxID=1529 RepID=UPI003995C26D